MIELFVNLSEDDANTCLLILASAGISCQITGQPDNWTVSVLLEDSEKALAEIERYFQENRETPDRPGGEDDWSRIPHKIHTGIGAALGLLSGHIFMIHHGGISFFAEKYGASASSILNGEIYRTVTALMIHSNSVHLAGNMASLALFACLPQEPWVIISPRFFTALPIFQSGHPLRSSGQLAFLSPIRHSAYSGLKNSASGPGFPWEAVSVFWDYSAKENIPIFWPIFLAWEAEWWSVASLNVYRKNLPAPHTSISPFH